MSTTPEIFWERVAEYKKLGINPLRWVAGCAVKVDLTTVVYPALRAIRSELERLGVHIAQREDADIFPFEGKDFEVERRIYGLSDLRVDVEDLRRINPSRAISLVQVYQKTGGSPESFAEVLLNVYTRISHSGLDLTVGKGHSIITTYPDDEFVLFDFFTNKEGRPEGWALANNDTIQLIDPTDEPGSAPQVYAAASNALNDLLSLGCHENLRMKPVIDGPNEEIRREIQDNAKGYARTYGIEYSDSPEIGNEKLLIGATFTGRMWKEPPTFYDRIEKGMEVLVSRPFGDLAPITVYLSCLADEHYLSKLKDVGFLLEQVERAKNDVVEVMKKPNIAVGRLINEACPPFGKAFHKDENIAATGDISGPGILVIKEIAERARVDVLLKEIPLLYPEYSRFATENFLMDNATSGTNGAIVIIAAPHLIRDIEKKLTVEGYRPRVIGRVIGRGAGRLVVEEEIKGFISSKPQLDELHIVKSVKEVER